MDEIAYLQVFAPFFYRVLLYPGEISLETLYFLCALTLWLLEPLSLN